MGGETNYSLLIILGSTLHCISVLYQFGFVNLINYIIAIVLERESDIAFTILQDICPTIEAKIHRLQSSQFSISSCHNFDFVVGNYYFCVNCNSLC